MLSSRCSPYISLVIPSIPITLFFGCLLYISLSVFSFTYFIRLCTFFIFQCDSGYFSIFIFHSCHVSTCTCYVESKEPTCCLSLPSRVITSFIGTMDKSDSSAVFVCTHHCIGRYSLLSYR